MTNEEKHAFLYSFFPFMHGIYPYTAPTQKQLYAMQQAGVDFQPLSIYKMTYATLKKLLSV